MYSKKAIFSAALLAIFVLAAYPMTVSAASKPGPTGGNTVIVSNGIYDVSVEDATEGTGIGTYTVSTGAAFPQPNQDVLFDGATHNPWSSYLTVRSYTTSTDYVTTTSIPTSNLDFAVVSIVSTATSVTIMWSVSPAVYMPDFLNITQVTAIEGTTVSDSRVRVTTNVTNTGNESVRIGIRYLWDLMIDGADGSWFAERSPNAPWISTENEWALPIFESYETTNDPANPIFTIFGTVTGPTTFTPPPTPPDLLQFAAWGSKPAPGVYDYAFDFTPSGRTIAGAGNDSAITYLWGNNETNAIELLPNETVSKTQYLSVLPGGPPTPPLTPTCTPMPVVPEMTPIGLIALVGLLLVVVAMSVIMRKRR